MNYSRIVSLSTPDMRLRNYICRAMMGEVNKINYLHLLVSKDTNTNAVKVSELTNVMGSYQAPYTISGDQVTFTSHIPVDDEGVIQYVAFAVGNAPGDEVLFIEAITHIEKSTQYSMDFNISLKFNL